MTTPTTPAHAMELAELIDAGEASAESANAMRSLAQQVEALTAENKNLLAANHHLIDAEQQAMDEVRSLTVERDALRTIIVDSVAALGTAASVSQTSSIEFLQDVPSEIRKTVDVLNLESKRLEFMLSNDAFLSTTKADGGFVVYQLWIQDEDENYQILSGDGFFGTPRGAIDAAMKAAS
jgi:hypothetical protein